jgi:hypothetical protein
MLARLVVINTQALLKLFQILLDTNKRHFKMSPQKYSSTSEAFSMNI